MKKRRHVRKKSMDTYLDAQVSMQEDLGLEGFGAVIGDNNAGAKPVLAQSDAVDEVEAVGPESLGLVVEGGRRQAEVELNRGVRRARRLRRRLAQELPPRVARESVLRQLRRRRVVGGSAEDLPW